MQREDVIARLKEHEAELRRLGVEHIYLFGSTACDEARDDLPPLDRVCREELAAEQAREQDDR